MTSPLVFAATEAAPSRLLSMSPVDYLIVAIYFVVVLAVGFYLKKYASTGEDFFMAGRKMTAWIAGLSFISANLSSLETMGWSAMAYQFGMLGASCRSPCGSSSTPSPTDTDHSPRSFSRREPW